MPTGRCLLAIVLTLAIGCSSGSKVTTGGTPDAGPTDAGTGPTDAGTPSASLLDKMHSLTGKLGAAHTGHFLIGMGNDGTNSGDDPAYHLGATLDLHYSYLVGLSSEGGWPTWNSNPDYAGKRINESKAHSIVPMLTYYCMAAHGDGNVAGGVQNSGYMQVWFKDYAQMLASANAAA